MSQQRYLCVDCGDRVLVPAGDDPGLVGVQPSGWYTCRVWETCPSCLGDLDDALARRWAR